jgi:hypothetical protein
MLTALVDSSEVSDGAVAQSGSSIVLPKPVNFPLLLASSTKPLRRRDDDLGDCELKWKRHSPETSHLMNPARRMLGDQRTATQEVDICAPASHDGSTGFIIAIAKGSRGAATLQVLSC